MMLPILESGYYLVKTDLYIHVKPGLTLKRLEQKIEKGSIVYIKTMKVLKYSIWGQIDDGWICVYRNHLLQVSRWKQ